MKQFIHWLSDLVKDERGVPSSKRIVGIVCAITLCVSLYHNIFYPSSIAPSAPLVDAVAMLAFGCLGLTSLDKYTNNKKQATDTQTP